MAFFENLFAVFAVGTVFFWLAITVLVCAITAALEFDSGKWATIFTVAGIFVLTQANKVSLPDLVTQHPWTVILATLGWFAIGVVWGVIKWWFWLHNRRDELLERGFKPGERDWTIPQVRDHKARILMWMTYWPTSALWTLINDPVRRAFRWAFGRVSAQLQRMSDRVFTNT